MNTKNIAEAIDIAAKLTIAIILFVLFGVEKERVAIETQRAAIEREQATALKVIADANSIQQISNFTAMEKIASYLDKAGCIEEDEQGIVDFYIAINNQYNSVQIGPSLRLQLVSASHACQSEATAIAREATGELPDAGAIDAATIRVDNRSHDGYVAVGAFEGGAFRNFTVETAAAVGDSGAIAGGAVIRARWTVNLRENLSDTRTGENRILSVLAADACVTVVESFPGTRGQTWALVDVRDTCD